jgi:hypothetical protein
MSLIKDTTSMVIGRLPNRDLLNSSLPAEGEHLDMPGPGPTLTIRTKNLIDVTKHVPRRPTQEGQGGTARDLRPQRDQGADRHKGVTETSRHTHRLNMADPALPIHHIIASSSNGPMVTLKVTMAIQVLTHPAVRHGVLRRSIHAPTRDLPPQCQCEDQVEMGIGRHLPTTSTSVLLLLRWAAPPSLAMALCHPWAHPGHLLALPSRTHQSVPSDLTLGCLLPFLDLHLLCHLRLVLFLLRRPVAGSHLLMAALLQ